MSARLPEVQRWMVDAIVSPVSPHDLDGILTASERMTADQRLEVYRTGYEARLVECLRDDY